MLKDEKQLVCAWLPRCTKWLHTVCVLNAVNSRVTKSKKTDQKTIWKFTLVYMKLDRKQASRNYHNTAGNADRTNNTICTSCHFLTMIIMIKSNILILYWSDETVETMLPKGMSTLLEVRKLPPSSSPTVASWISLERLRLNAGTQFLKLWPPATILMVKRNRCELVHCVYILSQGYIWVLVRTVSVSTRRWIKSNQHHLT